MSEPLAVRAWIGWLCGLGTGLALLLLANASAAGTMYGYVDGRGVAHLADRPLDGRYAPLLPDGTGPRVPGKSSTPDVLLTWLSFAPEVKSVQPLLREAARRTGVDAELLTAVVAVESGFRPDRVSPAGAIGLMQITPETGERYATAAEREARPVEQRLRDPRSNLLTGARMLADLTRRFNGIDAALAAWNAGEGRVRRAGNRVPDIAETRAHVHLVLELYWALLQQRQHSRAHRLSLATATDAPSP
jgi:hypothetical protein